MGAAANEKRGIGQEAGFRFEDQRLIAADVDIVNKGTTRLRKTGTGTGKAVSKLLRSGLGK